MKENNISKAAFSKIRPDLLSNFYSILSDIALPPCQVNEQGYANNVNDITTIKKIIKKGVLNGSIPSISCGQRCHLQCWHPNCTPHPNRVHIKQNFPITLRNANSCHHRYPALSRCSSSSSWCAMMPAWGRYHPRIQFTQQGQCHRQCSLRSPTRNVWTSPSGHHCTGTTRRAPA